MAPGNYRPLEYIVAGTFFAVMGGIDQVVGDPGTNLYGTILVFVAGLCLGAGIYKARRGTRAPLQPGSA